MDEPTAQKPPTELELAYQRANALRMDGRLDEAERTYRSVLSTYPAHANAATALAFMLRESGRLNAAADAMFWLWKACAKRPDDSIRTARFLRECDAWDVALTVCNEQLRLTPKQPRLLGLAGDFELALGRFEAAAARYRAALDLDPDIAKAWLRLVQTRRYERAGDSDIVRLRAASANPALTEAARLSVAFALGKALDDIDDCAAAVAALIPANRAAKQQSAWTAADWQAVVAA
ncbi:MAG: tetratricopeptide repeat protein, partial [Rhodanobacteraceae bacterium]